MNGLGSAGLRDLASALAANRSLRQLWCLVWKIQTWRLCLFGFVFAIFPLPTRLCSLRENNIEDDGLELLVGALANKERLERLE
jgi:hypothetical protein